MQVCTCDVSVKLPQKLILPHLTWPAFYEIFSKMSDSIKNRKTVLGEIMHLSETCYDLIRKYIILKGLDCIVVMWADKGTLRAFEFNKIR